MKHPATQASLKRFFSITLSALFISGAIVVGTGCSNAHPADKDSTARLENMPPALMKALQLTPQQQQKISAISSQGRQKSLPLTQQLQQERKALRVYLMSPKATEHEALEKGEQIRTIYRRLGELRLHTWFAIRGQLTPQQLKKLEHTDL